MDLGLKNRVALVAASSQGLGLATAEAFAAEGCKVAMCARNQQALEAGAERMRKQHGVEVLAEAFDVTDAGAVGRFVARVVAQFGGVDICVTNAGGPPAKRFLDITLEEWRAAIDLTLLSTVYFAREVLPRMQQRRWGRLLTITSVSVKQPIDGLLLSNSLRAAVTGLAKTLANEFGAHGITVNNVCPGYTLTERLDELAEKQARLAGIPRDQVFDTWSSEIPIGRLARPDEFAALVAFLASERASSINGTTIAVDGGWVKGLL